MLLNLLKEEFVQKRIKKLNRTLSATPSKPSKLEFRDIRRDSVLLEWDTPEFDGGAKLTGYVIEKRDVQKKRWSYVHKVEPSTQSYRVAGLTTDHKYMFRVMPKNRIGCGDAIQPETPIHVLSPYSKHSNSYANVL